MRRVVLIAFFGLLTFDVSGLSALCGEPPCDESCPADASGGECAPNCDFCACCSLPRVAQSMPTALAPAPNSMRNDAALVPPLPQSPDAADILHVPKHLLA